VVQGWLGGGTRWLCDGLGWLVGDLGLARWWFGSGLRVAW
jgi:hypothetical protein